MIGDGEKPNVMPASSKQALRAMLASVVANTPGAVPVKRIPEGEVALSPVSRPAMGSSSASPDEPPSAYQVAVAIVAASREMGADPESVAMGVTTRGGRYGDHSIPRARAYAAYAIKHVFPNNGNTGIGRWVGAKSANSYMAMLEAQRRNKLMRWWDEKTFKRIVLRLSTTPREVS